MSQAATNPNDAKPVALSRRAFLGRLTAAGTVTLSASTLLAACGGDAETADEETGLEGGLEAQEAAESPYPVVDASSCQGYNTLDPAALQTRQSLQYVDVSPNQGQYCGNCRFLQDYPADAKCGGCQLFAGPVSPGGYCVSWTATEM